MGSFFYLWITKSHLVKKSPLKSWFFCTLCWNECVFVNFCQGFPNSIFVIKQETFQLNFDILWQYTIFDWGVSVYLWMHNIKNFDKYIRFFHGESIFNVIKIIIIIWWGNQCWLLTEYLNISVILEVKNIIGGILC